MLTYKRFEEMQAWQLGKRIAVEIYRLTSEGRFSEDIVFRHQLRRAAVSVSSVIAGGYGRGGSQHMRNGLSAASGAGAEVRSLLDVARELGFVEESDYRRVLRLCLHTEGVLESTSQELVSVRTPVHDLRPSGNGLTG